MKAHVVKGDVFAVVFLLAARFREAAAGAAGWAIVVFVSPSCGFWPFVPGWLSILLRRESCIRRGFRHEPMLIGCRIHPETWVLVMRVSRLAELGRTG
jgi:hypothetical protein